MFKFLSIFLSFCLVMASSFSCSAMLTTILRPTALAVRPLPKSTALVTTPARSTLRRDQTVSSNLYRLAATAPESKTRIQEIKDLQKERRKLLVKELYYETKINLKALGIFTPVVISSFGLLATGMHTVSAGNPWGWFMMIGALGIPFEALRIESLTTVRLLRWWAGNDMDKREDVEIKREKLKERLLELKEKNS